MKPTDILKSEHRLIERMLNVLEKFCEKLNEKEFNKIDAEKMIDFFKNFADKCHHGKEEDMLFPEMEGAGIPREGGPIGVMLFEHIEGRNFIKGMDSAIKEGNFQKFKEKAISYIELLRNHIFKEDNILFNMADIHIDKKTQGELLEKFEKFEKEVIGEGVHEKYQKLIHEMEKNYK
ncbi:MAG: hemerythrin domain-containing protein [candidate division WOR-3 bacterium]